MAMRCLFLKFSFTNPYFYLDQLLFAKHIVPKKQDVIDFADFQQQNLVVVVFLIAVVKTRAPYYIKPNLNIFPRS